MAVMINKNYSKKSINLQSGFCHGHLHARVYVTKMRMVMMDFIFQRFVKMIVLTQPHCVCILVI